MIKGTTTTAAPTIPPSRMKRKTQKQQKSKIKKSKTQKNLKGGRKGKGFFKALFTRTVPAIYTNVKYTKHNTTFPGISKLTCPICKRHVFKMHRMKIATYGKGLLINTNFFNDSFNFFKCIDCGHAMVFSNDIDYTETKYTKDSGSSEA